MEIDPVGQHQPQQRQPQQANLGSSNVPSMGLQHTLLQLQAPAPATFSSRGGSNRPPNMNNQASLPLPTTLRGFGEVKQELEPAPGMDRMPSLPVPEDMGLGMALSMHAGSLYFLIKGSKFGKRPPAQETC